MRPEAVDELGRDGRDAAVRRIEGGELEVDARLRQRRLDAQDARDAMLGGKIELTTS